MATEQSRSGWFALVVVGSALTLLAGAVATASGFVLSATWREPHRVWPVEGYDITIAREPAVGVIVAMGILVVIGIVLMLVGAYGWGKVTATLPQTPVATGHYPAALSGELREPLSRWLWLVKWILVIPHVVVLGVLWVAFAVVTIAAGFTILFTGHFPRPFFEFSVGVLRWNWRVAFYAYSALGTDIYPPFSLDPADYPASLAVQYPERLSHGLVLVKWWLLAIPHLVILGVVGGGGWGLGWGFGGMLERGHWSTGAGASLLGLLVLVAAIILLFSGKYQRPLFDLIMGLNRWAFRVAAYVTLLRDEYPPFRLDQGGTEPVITGTEKSDG